MVDSSRDVVVVSGTPTSGATLVRFHADGTRGTDVPLSAELGASGEGRLAWIESGATQAFALLTPTGTLAVFQATGAPVEFALATPPAPVQALDLDGQNASVSLDLTGARFDDIAAVFTQPVTAGQPPTVDFFVTGATAATGTTAGRPFLLRARVQLGATAATSTLTVSGLATSQGAVTDPAHRSGVGVFWHRTGTLLDTPATGIVVAALPTSGSATGGGDAIIVAGVGFPDDPTIPPTQITDERGAPLFADSSGMTEDLSGNLYLLFAKDACSVGGGPGLVALTATDAPCVDLPATTTTSGGYVDVGVRDPGDPGYVTDRTGNAVLSVTTGVQASAVPGPGASRAAASTVGGRVAGALQRVGAGR